MKKAFWIIILFSLFAAGCKKDAKPTAVAPPPLDSSDVRTSATGEKISNLELRYFPNLGSEYIYELTSSGRDSSSMKADTNITSVENTKMVYKLKVIPVEIKKDSSTLYNVTFLDFLIDYSRDNNKVSYRSGMKLDDEQKAMFIPYEAALNNNCTVQISSTGELLKVMNTDKILSKVLELEKAPRNLKPEQREFKRGQIERAIIFSSVQQLFGILSKSRVSDNSSWDFNSDYPLTRFFKFKIKRIHTLKGLEKLGESKVARIEIKTQTTNEVDSIANKNAVNVEQATLDFTGKQFFDVDKKMISFSKTSFKISTFLKGDEQTPKGLIHVQVKQSSEKVISVNLLETRQKASSK